MLKVYTISVLGGEKKNITAMNPSEALKLSGELPVTKISVDFLKTYELNFGVKRVVMNRKEALQFAQQMSLFLGVIPDFIQATQMALARFKDKKAIKRRMNILRRKLGQEAVSRAQAVESIGFPREFLPILTLAEESRNFSEAFQRIASTLHEEAELKQTLRNALVAPVMTLVVLFAAFAVMILFVFPKLMELFQQAAGQHPSGILLFDMFLVNNKYQVFSGVVAFFGVLALWLFSKSGRKALLDFAFLVPFLKDVILIYRATKFSMALEMPILAAQPLKESLDQILKSAAGSEKRIYRKILTSIIAGQSLKEALEKTAYFPDDFTSWVGSVADAGQLPQEITTIRETYEKLLKQRFETAKTFIGPILLIVAGGSIILMAGALYAPILDLVQSFMTQSGQ